MWSDTLLRAEQQHLLRLMAWAALSIVTGTGVATMLAVRRDRSPLLSWFAANLAFWGVVIGAYAVVAWERATLRDVSGAARLEHVVWMAIGLDVGYVLVGAVLGVSGWVVAKRAGAVGAGISIMIHGLALLLLELQFASVISR